MDRLKYGQKFVLIGFMILLLFGITLYVVLAHTEQVGELISFIEYIKDESGLKLEANGEDVLQLRQQQAIIAVASLLILLLIFYLFVAFYISVLRAVYELKRAALRVMRGRLDTRAEVRTQDELAQVGVAFNKMIDSFRKMLKEREKDKRQIEHLAYHDALTGLPNRSLGTIACKRY